MDFKKLHRAASVRYKGVRSVESAGFHGEDECCLVDDLFPFFHFRYSSSMRAADALEGDET